jgi:hypothetical protein
MPLFPDYTDSASLKSFLHIPDADTVDNAELAIAITAASRAVDQHCSRQFGNASASRSYTYKDECIDGRRALRIDDATAVTGVTVLDSSGATVDTLTSADFDLWPWNAAADGFPYTHVVLKPDASSQFSCEAKGNTVAATFGWSAVPSPVEQATLFQAARFFARRNAPFGVAGSPDLGNELRLLDKMDPDVAVILQRFRRTWAA